MACASTAWARDAAALCLGQVRRHWGVGVGGVGMRVEENVAAFYLLGVWEQS